MKKFLFLFILAVGFCNNAFGQNGKLISQKPYTIPDSSFVKIEKWIPGIKSAVSQVEFS